MRCLLLLILLPTLATAKTPKASPTTVHERMQTHFELTTRIERAIVRGDLDEVHAAGKELRALPNDGMPDSWQPWLEDIGTFARMSASAESLPDAARSLTLLGESCATCHETTGGGPKLDSNKVPEQDWTGASHMSRHQWASTWMWLGIIKPDLTAYRRGARVLAEQPLMHGSDHPALPQAAAGLDDQVHALAAKALAATDPHTRATTYADILATCSTCHMAMETQAATP